MKLKLLDTIVKSISPYTPPPTLVTPSTYPDESLARPSSWYFWPDATLTKQYEFQYADTNSAKKAYEQCAPLCSIINRKAQADLNGKRYVMNTQGREANTAEAKAIKRLMNKPNKIQNWRQFRVQQKIYEQLFGYSVVMVIIPAGFKDVLDATSMWNIPPFLLEIKETGKLFYQSDLKGIIESVKLRYSMRKEPIPLDLDSLYFFKDITPAFDSMVLPTSRVRSLQMPINNIIASMNSRNTLIIRRGALGIISPKGKDGTGGITIPLKDEEKIALQNDWRKYGTQSDQYNVVISNAAINWTRISMDVGELKLHEEVDESSLMLCDGYNYPPHLMGLLDPTFNNQQAAEKGLYNNAIIPEAEADDDQWNELFHTEENNLKIVSDFKDLPVLQEEKEKQASARYKLNQALLIEFQNDLITRNRWLELLNEDTLPASEGDLYYSQLVKAGKIYVNGKPTTTTNKPEEGSGQEGTGEATQPETESVAAG